MAVTAINGSGAYRLTWDFEETPGLVFFDIACAKRGQLEKCGEAPADARSFDLVLEDPASVYKLRVHVVAFAAPEIGGDLSRPVEITVSQSKLSIGCQCFMHQK